MSTQVKRSSGFKKQMDFEDKVQSTLDDSEDRERQSRNRYKMNNVPYDFLCFQHAQDAFCLLPIMKSSGEVLAILLFNAWLVLKLH